MVEALDQTSNADLALPSIPLGYAIRMADLRVKERRAAVIRDCSTVTPEYECKWDALCRTDGSLDFDAMDEVVAFAEAHRMGLHGHTLCWHRSIPRRFLDVDPERFRAAATAYLSNVVRRYQGAMLSWHVVNEPLQITDGYDDGLRVSPYLSALGADYIHKMFRLVRTLDPQALLVLNEMGLEYDSPAAEQKRQLMLALLQRLMSEDVPIDCLGLQSHLNARDFLSGNHRNFARWLQEIKSLGLSIEVTELDVDDRDLEGDVEARDETVARVYLEYVEMVKTNARLSGVTLWGVSDEGSWLNTSGSRLAARPLALDAYLMRKPAWFVLQASSRQV
ncbi:endo-1,4-beta-xylanase [Devosia submarina]|uniref:endo-1,4-beta-xylanase n=1 Tax=Devosia submarina TaxID=1173082 RepID=UPI001300BC84|nr:endo-1,4-beta-xylanase [Devosia submarina]